MRPVALRPFLAECLPLSFVGEGFHRQNEAVNENVGGVRRNRQEKIKPFKNSVVEFYIIEPS